MAMPRTLSDLTSSLPSSITRPGTQSAGPTPTQDSYDNLPSNCSNDDQGLRISNGEKKLAHQRQIAREANDERFATLFEPSTPRASPNLQATGDPSPVPYEPLDPTTASSIPLSVRAARHTSHHPRTASVASTASSDFGAFVEVSSSNDPLSASLEPDLSGDAFEVNISRDSHVQSDQLTSRMTILGSTIPPQQSANTSLNFFDTFTQDAKQRSSAARSHVLDELLQHEDDPMWFTMQSGATALTGEHAPDGPLKPEAGSSTQLLDSTTANAVDGQRNANTMRQTASGSIHDIDHDYFRLPGMSPSTHTQVSPNSLRRIASLAPPSLAPPIESQLVVSPPTNASHSPSQADLDAVLEFDPLAETPQTTTNASTTNQGPNLAASGRSSSLQTLSSMPSKLVSTLFKTATDTQDQSLVSPNLGSRRNSSQPPPSSPSLSKYNSRQTASTSSSSPSASLTDLIHQPSLVQSQGPDHFASAEITHGTSPFAPTVYVPPSGAPGFTGDRYNWDKGYSEELEVERKGRNVVKQRDHPSQQLGYGGTSPGLSGAQSSGGNFGVGNWVAGGRAGWGGGFGFGFGSVRSGKAKSPTPNSILGLGFGGGSGNGEDDSTTVGRRSPFRDVNAKGGDVIRNNGHDRQADNNDMAEFIEKKLGSLELVGRKLSSVPVLTSELATELRVHLPALSRLSKSWNLIYSLDQHGISLNTLYSQCEAYLSRKPTLGDIGLSKGMLLIIKDAADQEDGQERTVFGAWIAEGLRLNKGKGYAGGGESFLWKYADQQLRVFKTTGKNNYVALCEPDYISFGGGDGHYGLYLDDTLFEGSSAPCPTFDNEPLCSSPPSTSRKSVKFECVGLEVWGMAS